MTHTDDAEVLRRWLAYCREDVQQYDRNDWLRKDEAEAVLSRMEACIEQLTEALRQIAGMVVVLSREELMYGDTSPRFERAQEIARAALTEDDRS